MGGLPSGRSHRELDIQIPIQGVVGDAQVGAVLAAFDMPAQRRRPAALERRHDLQLAEAHVAGMGGTPSRPAAAEDVRHLDRRP